MVWYGIRGVASAAGAGAGAGAGGSTHQTMTTRALEGETEWLDRGQRAHNIIVIGWETVEGASPLEDAKRYFAKIGFTLVELFLAFRAPWLLKDGVFRTRILKVTFNSIPTCH